MAKFGAYQVHRACRHAFGHVEMELEPGRFEPTSLEEAEAMEHLSGVLIPGEIPHRNFAARIEGPDGAVTGETGVVRPTTTAVYEPGLPEPTGAPPVDEPAAEPALADAPVAASSAKKTEAEEK